MSQDRDGMPDGGSGIEPASYSSALIEHAAEYARRTDVADEYPVGDEPDQDVTQIELNRHTAMNMYITAVTHLEEAHKVMAFVQQNWEATV